MTTLFNQLILKKGWIELAELERSITIQQAEDPQRPLGLILVERELLTREQLVQLLDLQRQTLINRQARRRGEETLKQAGPLDGREETRLLRSRALELGLLAADKLDAARALGRERGIPLWSALVDGDFLTAHQLQRLRKSLREGRVICYHCREKIHFDYGQLPSSCPDCQVDFPRDRLFTTEAWLVANWPQHVGDRLLESLMRKQSLLDDVVLAQCHELQNASFPHKDLGKTMLELGHATLNQLYELYQQRQERLVQELPHLDALRRDVRLGRLIVARRFASLGKVNDALLKQARVIHEKGEYHSLLDALFRQGLITADQAVVRLPEMFAQVVEDDEDIQFDLERILCEERQEDPKDSAGSHVAKLPEPEFVMEDDLPDVDGEFESYYESPDY